MEELGARLAHSRPPADALRVLYLSGDLGTGKTTLARGFLRECGVRGLVRSPTYSLMELHETAAISLLHLDLYRLREPGELDQLGVREWARPSCIWIVEWPERAAGRLPGADLILELTAAASEHQIEARAGSAVGQHWLKAAGSS